MAAAALHQIGITSVTSTTPPDEYKAIKGNHEFSQEAQNLLENMLDHKNVNSTIHPVSTVFDLQKNPSTTWNEQQDDLQRGNAFVASSRPIQSNLSFQNRDNSQGMKSKKLGRALISAQNISRDIWTFDTAASDNITANFSLLQNPVKID